MLTTTIPLPTEQELKNVLTRRVVREALCLENECIKKVLEQALRRTPLLEDFRKCTSIHHQAADFYYLCYNGRKLGTIHRALVGNEFMVEFRPAA